MLDYLALARLQTLPLAFVPLCVSLFYAHYKGFSPGFWLTVSVFACPALLQIAANAHNDAKDFIRGVDTEKRLGPRRMASSGTMSIGRIRRFALLCLFGAWVPGAYAVWQGGWVLAGLGLVCVAGAASYSGGKKPVSFSPFGELYVVLFFGLIAVAGSFFAFTGSNDFGVYPLALSMGCLAANVLLVNNYRDADGDREAGRKTLCVLAGRTRAIGIYRTFFMAAHFFTLWGMGEDFSYPFYFLPFAGLPFFIKTADALEKNPIDETLNRFLPLTVLLQGLHALLICLSYLLDDLAG